MKSPHHEYLRGIAQRCLARMPQCRDMLRIYWSQQAFDNYDKAAALGAIESVLAEAP